MEDVMERRVEKRWAKRMGINAKIRLQSIKNNKAIAFNLNKDEFDVEVVNISKGGMAFRTAEFLPLNSFYDAQVVLWTKETFEAIIEIVRMENLGDDDNTTYGCKFIGLGLADQFKIDVYQIVTEE